MKLHELAIDIHETIIANGFDAASWDTAVHKLAYVITEIDEAIDAVKGNGDDPLPEELADVAIRLMDLLAGVAGDTWGDRVTGGRRYTGRVAPYNQIEVLMWPIAAQCCKAIECWRHNDNKNNFVIHLEYALKETFLLADDLDIDLLSEVKRKHEKNKTRGLRHGKANPRA